MSDPSLKLRALRYAELSRIAIDLESPLGHGTDGAVWKSLRNTAIKALERERNYRIELECYQRFFDHGVERIQGFSIPKLIGFNDEALVVEIEIVTPPFILDFAKAWLDHPPEFSAEQWDDWDREGQERFEGCWPDVLNLLSELKQYGIYYYDAKPQNIMFGDEGTI